MGLWEVTRGILTQAGLGGGDGEGVQRNSSLRSNGHQVSGGLCNSHSWPGHRLLVLYYKQYMTQAIPASWGATPLVSMDTMCIQWQPTMYLCSGECRCLVCFLLPFSFSPGRGRVMLTSGQIFSLQLNLSGNMLTDRPRKVDS